jgi:hypothetical protein
MTSRLELSAFISHQRLSSQSNRNLGETLYATTRTNYRKLNYGLLHCRAPKIVAFLSERDKKVLPLDRFLVNVMPFIWGRYTVFAFRTFQRLLTLVSDLRFRHQYSSQEVVG